ncbi:MAG: ECF transporter S component [Lachnospiraceae bacterium]|nr:ECF transporter S component [Lachnospiraceae bacterium]
MNGLLQSVKENVVFCLVFLGIIAGMFVLAYVVELAFKKKNGDTEKMLSTRKMAMVGVFSATAVVLYVLDFPVPFAPPFYKLDFSEIPVLVGSFAFGPVAGVMIEFVKILLKLLLKGTDTAFVGDLANFMVGCSFILPASFLYQFKKSKKNAILGCITGTLVMTVFGTAFNAVYLIPTFAKLYGMPLDVIIAMGTKIHASIDNVVSLVVMCVAPLNLVKGTSVSLITVLVYKKLSPILKSGVRR